MNFCEVLQRYGLGKLCYEDGTPLSERDYAKLFSTWMGYKFVTSNQVIFMPSKERMKRVYQTEKRMLFPLEDEDKMDIIMKIPSQIIENPVDL